MILGISALSRKKKNTKQKFFSIKFESALEGRNKYIPSSIKAWAGIWNFHCAISATQEENDCALTEEKGNHENCILTSTTATQYNAPVHYFLIH